jgi:hypothetical protein
LQNPWLRLPEEAPYVLEVDRESIQDYNHRKKSGDQRIDLSLLPEPFIGDPCSARLVLLNLNPGLDRLDAKAHADPEFRVAMLRNLRHERQEYPFYPLNPKFEWTPCGRWWLKHLKQLIGNSDRAAISKRLLVVEWFPYHSIKSGLPNRMLCESQRYSWQLAKELREKGTLMVLMRSKGQWSICDKKFSELRLPSSIQNPCVTAANFGDDLYRLMKKALAWSNSDCL